MAETLTNSINKMSVDDENMQEVKMENDFNIYCKNLLSFFFFKKRLERLVLLFQENISKILYDSLSTTN